jgi:hypothetical protein
MKRSIKILTIAAILLIAFAAAGCGTCIDCTCMPFPEAGPGTTSAPIDVEAPTDDPMASLDPSAIPSGADPLATPSADPSEDPWGGQTADPTGETTPDPYATPVPTGTVTARFDRSASVVAIATGTYGVASDGSVRFTGNPVSEQNLIYGLSNIVSVAANDSTTALLSSDGTVTVIGSLKRKFGEAENWTGILEIAMGEKHLVGLRIDGTVVACGDNSSKQCAVSSWSGVKKIVAAGNYTMALTENGVLSNLGGSVMGLINGASDPSVPTRAIDVAAAKDHFAVLRENGTVISCELFSGGEAGHVFEWTNIVKVFASEGATFGVDAGGALHTDSKLIKGSVSDVYSVSASKEHAVVLHGDGKCEGFGANKYLQTNVGGWRLLPYTTSDGWLIGFAPGNMINGSRVKTGMQVSYTEPATGKTKSVTCVMLGDVNGDGSVDNKDVDAIKKHISGEKKLQGAFLRAANVIKDGSKPNSIDVCDRDAVVNYIAGKTSLDFYGKTDMYTSVLADARRKNSDALGYITIEDTNISYPIMYDFNWYYNDHDIDRNQVVRGSIYFYWGEPTGNIVITGHNSRVSGTMFHQLHKIQNNKSKLATFKNRVWCINTYGETGYWEVWAMYEEGRFASASQSSQYYNTNFPNGFDSMSTSQKQAWIDYQLKRTELKYTVNVTTEDRFMVITTCGDDHADSAYGARLYFFLRWVGGN